MDAKEQELHDLIAQGESLTLEFKSDMQSLPDRELVATVMSLANTDGGDILFGVEDNGMITGLQGKHKDVLGIVSLIANRTNPSISVNIENFFVCGKIIARIKVPKSKALVSTTDGLLQRRRIMSDGKPGSVPFYPHEFVQRQSSLGLMDPTAMPMTHLTMKDFSPVERHRIRDAVQTYHGDKSLLELTDDELDGALGLVVEIDGVCHPTLAGLLLLGKEEVLRQHVPSHEIAFQVLEGTEVRMNEFFRKPLIRSFEEVERSFVARITEQELEIGFYRVPVPNFERHAFREAFVNALVHRDYARLGAIHVMIDNNGLSISNPGGFVDGVTVDNLLVTKPRPRNPLLADICKRIGLSERTGRGIDRIYEGLLRYGRPAPDYHYSDSSCVVVRMSDVEGDKEFLKFIINEEKRSGKPLSLDSLIVLARLRTERRLTISHFMHSTQKPEQEVRSVLEHLVESGLIEAHGTNRDRAYTLSANLYQKSGQIEGYVRQVGFDSIQQEQMIINYITNKRKIKRAEAADLCRINTSQAKRILLKLVKEGAIIARGEGRGTYYKMKASKT